MKKRLNYDLMNAMIAEGKPAAEISWACACSYTAVWSRLKALGKTGVKSPPKYTGAVVTLPSIESLAVASARAIAKRMGMKVQELIASGWFRGKIFTRETGWAEKRENVTWRPRGDAPESYNFTGLRGV